MKWKSHIAIAEALAQEARLPHQLRQALRDGSVEPDSIPDARLVGGSKRNQMGRVPHHGSTSGTTRTYLWKARRAYLNGNDVEAVWLLGRALHYVQDGCVSVGFLRGSHRRLEENIVGIEPCLEEVRRGMRSAVSSPLFVDKCLREIRPRRNPHDIMRQASFYSAALMACVLDNSRSREEFWREHSRSRRLHWIAIAPLSAGMMVALGLVFYITGDVGYLIMGALAGPIILMADRRYYRSKIEVDWFYHR